eukprot:14959919-Heterocapsa_arctica.AAC.1
MVMIKLTPKGGVVGKYKGGNEWQAGMKRPYVLPLQGPAAGVESGVADWTGVAGLASTRAARWARGSGPAGDADGNAKPSEPTTGPAAEQCDGEPDKHEHTA